MNKIEHVDEIYKSNHFDIPFCKFSSKIEKFKCKPDTMIPNDYADDDDFGLGVDDLNEAWLHARGIFYELLDEFDKTHTVKEWKLQQGLKDLHNIFCCLEYTPVKESQIDVLAVCEVFLYLGKADQLLYAIDMSLDILLPHKETYAIEFDYARLMIELGDILLCQGNGMELAYKFYVIARRQLEYEKTVRLEHNDHVSSVEPNCYDKWLYFLKRMYKGYPSSPQVVMEYFDETHRNILLRYSGYYEQVAYSIVNHYPEGILQGAAKLWYNLREDMSKGNLHSREILRAVLFMAQTVQEFAVWPLFAYLSGREGEETHKLLSDVASYLKKPHENISEEEQELICSLHDEEKGDWYLTHYAECYYAIEKIRLKLKPRGPLDIKDDIGYYTSYKSFCYMLPEVAAEQRYLRGKNWGWTEKEDYGKAGRLSVMNIAYMNDPTEGSALYDLFNLNNKDSLVEGKKERKSAEFPVVFLKCFTYRIDDIPMWEMYGGQAEGVCVILDFKKMVKLPLYYVCYLDTKAEKPVEKINNQNLDEKTIDLINKNLNVIRQAYNMGNVKVHNLLRYNLTKIQFLFKNKDYNHERELRVIYDDKRQINHTMENPPKLYVQPDEPVAIKEIILGPKFKKVRETMPYLQEQLRIMSKINNTSVPKITLSGVPYV